MTDKRVVLTTIDSAEGAHRLAEALVDRKLAACVNILPKIASIYRWQGKVEQAEEWLLLIKTTDELFPRLREAIKELHSYEVPECISLAIEDGLPDYLKWIAESVEAGGTDALTVEKAGNV